MGNMPSPTRYTSPHGNGVFVRIKDSLTSEQKRQYEGDGLHWAEAMDATQGRFGIIIGADKHEANSCVRFILPDARAKAVWYYREGWFTIVPEADVPTALVTPLKQAHTHQARKEAADAAADEAASLGDTTSSASASPRCSNPACSIHGGPARSSMQSITLAGLASIDADIEKLRAEVADANRKLDTLVDALAPGPARTRRRLNPPTSPP